MSDLNIFIGKPNSSHISQLRSLWKDTFGDSDDFLDIFQSTAFSLERCRCVFINDKIVAALYWFDCIFHNQPIAYLYAIATEKSMRNQGLCHKLMDNAHKHLQECGYAGAILSPAEKSLFNFYEKMGYKTCAYNSELFFEKDTLYTLEDKKISLRKISKEEFAKLRPTFLPKDAVLQEKENLYFLERQADFYAGDNFLLTAQKIGTHLQGIEFLGDTSVIPFILQSLACTSGYFRIIGNEKAFGMYHSFTEEKVLPSYFGFAFD